MIQPAAPSITSSLALNTGSQAAQGDDAAVSGDFAALLSASLVSGGDMPIDPAATPDQATALQLRQQPGNPSGKQLPPALPELDAALTDATELTEAGTPATGEKPVTALLDTILPGLALSLRSSQASPMPTVKTSSSIIGLVKAALSRPSPAVTTDETASPAELDTDQPDDTAIAEAETDAAPMILPQIQSPTTAAPTLFKPMADVAWSATTKPTSVLAAAQTAVQVAANVPADQPTIEPAPITPPVPTVSATPTEPAAIPAGLALPKAETDASEKAAPTATMAVPMRSSEKAPANQPNRQTSIPAGPQVQMMAATADSQLAAPQTDTPAPILTARADEAAPKAALAAAAASAQDAQTADRKIQPGSAPAPADTPVTLAAVEPRPVLTSGDTQTLTQTIDPVTTTATAAPLRQAGHDFTKIVDRLVEAREAAMPQAVSATISHGEFGQVSLRFDQDAGGLSVAMSSADPDFARAVQASAASAQSQTASDNGSNGPRQDATSQQQQTAGSASGQPQPQSNSQASARSAPAQTDNRSGSQSGEQGPDDETADARNGIYA